jgi:hypothetical protein
MQRLLSGLGVALVALGTILTSVGLLSNAGVTDISLLMVPGPATWTMMIGGFGLAGASIRRRVKLPVPKRINI